MELQEMVLDFSEVQLTSRVCTVPGGVCWMPAHWGTGTRGFALYSKPVWCAEEQVALEKNMGSDSFFQVSPNPCSTVQIWAQGQFSVFQIAEGHRHICRCGAMDCSSCLHWLSSLDDSYPAIEACGEVSSWVQLICSWGQCVFSNTAISAKRYKEIFTLAGFKRCHWPTYTVR